MGSIQNIVTGQGFELTIAGMVIVFAALLAMYFLIRLLPRVLEGLQKRWPELFAREDTPAPTREVMDERTGSIVAAIAWALHRRTSSRN